MRAWQVSGGVLGAALLTLAGWPVAVHGADTTAPAASAVKPLSIALTTPAQFVVGETTIVAALVKNSTDKPYEARVALRLKGLSLRGVASVDTAGRRQGVGALAVAARGEGKVEWTVVATKPGEAKIRVSVESGGLTDLAEKTIAVVTAASPPRGKP